MPCRTFAIAFLLALGVAHPAADPAARFRAGVHREGGLALPYRLFAPPSAGPARRLPLILALHGLGARGRDNLAQLTAHPLATPFAGDSLQARFPAFILAPQCPPESTWINKGHPIAGRPLNGTSRAVLALLDSLLRVLPADPDRVYLVGLSMGGHAAWELAMRHPDRFAAVVPICGLGDTAQAGRLKDVPVWAFHGDADATVPISGSRDMVAAIRRAGGRPRYTEYAGGGHDAWTPALRDPALAPWLFSQNRRGRGEGGPP